jgi:hypothetical protein
MRSDETEWNDMSREEELTGPQGAPGSVEQDPGVFDDVQYEMPDHEAWRILERITQTQDSIARTENNAKEIVANKRVDLKRYLANYERLPRLLTWYARNLQRNRRTVSTLTGSIAQETVPASLRVANKDEALTWCKVHCPKAIVESIDGDKLPKPEKRVGEGGVSVWVAPEGSGLEAVPEREEIVVNKRYLRTLLEGRSNARKKEE